MIKTDPYASIVPNRWCLPRESWLAVEPLCRIMQLLNDQDYMFQLSWFVRSGSHRCYKHRSSFCNGFIQMHAPAHTSTFCLAHSSCLCKFCNAVHWAGTLVCDMGSLWLRMAPCHCCPACSLPARWLVPFPAICSCLARLLATARLCPSCSVKNPSRGRHTCA